MIQRATRRRSLLAAGVTYTLAFDREHVSGVNSVQVSLKGYDTNTYAPAETFVANAVLTPAANAWTHYTYTYTFAPATNVYLSAEFRLKVGASVGNEVFLQ